MAISGALRLAELCSFLGWQSFCLALILAWCPLASAQDLPLPAAALGLVIFLVGVKGGFIATGASLGGMLLFITGFPLGPGGSGRACCLGADRPGRAGFRRRRKKQGHPDFSLRRSFPCSWFCHVPRGQWPEPLVFPDSRLCPGAGHDFHLSAALHGDSI